MTEKSPTITETQHATNANKKDNTGFVPAREELIHLVKYWVRWAIADEYFIFWGQCFGNSDLRDIDHDWERVNEIAEVLGEEETDRAVKKAYEEAAQEGDQHRYQYEWIVFRYGTRDERRAFQDKGGQCFEYFECGVAEEMARDVEQRVFREGTAEQQRALVKDKLAPYARKLHGYRPRGGHFVEVFGISFPGELRNLILSTGVDDDPQPNGFFEAISIEQAKAFLAMLDEAAQKGEDALKALIIGSRAIKR